MDDDHDHQILDNLTAVHGNMYESKQTNNMDKGKPDGLCLAYVVSQFASTDLSSLSHMPPEIRTDLLLALQAAFKAGKLGAPYEGSSSTGKHSSQGDDEPAVAVEESE